MAVSRYFPDGCPYCKHPVFVVDSHVVYGTSYGLVHKCSNELCDAYVGCHKNSDIPLGRMANKQLRKWKILAHNAFDPLWKTGRMTRREAYTYMQKIMKMDRKEAHIGKFDVMECRKLVRALYGKESQDY